MKPVRVVVCGVAGRMGGSVLRALRAEDGMQVVGATERPDSPQVGLDAGAVAGGPPLGISVSGSLEAALSIGADVAIDFTAPAAAQHHAQACAARKVALVLGTTGISQ